MGPDQGCQTRSAGLSSSAWIGSTGPIDDTFYTVFFSSDNCNPDTVVTKGDEGCVTVENYKSFAVWDMCKPDEPGCLLV